MRRYSPRASSLSYAFGPGPITPAVKWIIMANVAMYVGDAHYPDHHGYLGLIPRRVIEAAGSGSSPPTCSCMRHGPHPLQHARLWMFGVELERLWGTKFFVRYYAITGVGAV